jgi:apolipoprotein N-acyltransferase
VWQQRSGAVAFRMVLGSMPVLAALLLIPNGIDRLSAVGLIVLVMIAFWFGSVWNASIASLIAAAALLRATPLRLPHFAAAGLRYPLWIFGLGVAWIGIALGLQSAHWALIVLVLLALAAFCALAYTLALRLRHQPARLPLRLSVEAVLVIAIWQALGPLALIAVVGLVWRNYQQSKTTA